VGSSMRDAKRENSRDSEQAESVSKRTGHAFEGTGEKGGGLHRSP